MAIILFVNTKILNLLRKEFTYLYLFLRLGILFIKTMKNKQALTRYRLIDNRMTNRQKPAPSLQDLVEYVSDKLGSAVSTSCIQKDLYAMRYNESLGYSAPIAWDSNRRGYVYTEPDYSINNLPVSEADLQGLEMAIGLLEQFKDIPAIRVFEDAISRLATTVKMNRQQHGETGILILDRPKRYQGIEYMSDMVEAIREKKILRITYQTFTSKEPKKHTVHPYFIKEYNGRMYLIGKDIHPVKESKFLTFAFDRMSDVIKMNQSFTEEQIDPAQYFKSAIGISLTDAKPEEIVLAIDPLQARYIKTQPLHHSQRIIKETATELHVGLELVINYELRSLILGMGNKVKVLKPKQLALQLHEIASDMVQLYSGLK